MNATLVISERPERAEAFARWMGLHGVEAVPCARDRELVAVSLANYDVTSVLLWVDKSPESRAFLTTIRELTQAPVIAIGSAEDLDSLVEYLDLGATDYIPGSMPMAQIARKIQELAPTTSGDRDPVIRVGDLTIDVGARDVTSRKERIPLTSLEFKLLHVLAENAGRACSRKMLLNRVWGAEFEGRLHYLRLYIGYLRQKLEKDPRKPRILLTEWGYGYRLALPSTAGRERVLRPAFRSAGSN
jgi:two-component system KDP operon response regulator KdpE